jgi:UDP-N-acetyl-D-galactosamine dehydrogenase
MNELAIICERAGIETAEVLGAAGTKWNFVRFRPGLVGGHCIGVDPYYLMQKAEMLGYHPRVIPACRRINDGMGKYVAEQTIKRILASGSPIKGARVSLLGCTYKENCPDMRNTKVADVIVELRSSGVQVFVHDPVADPQEARKEYGIRLLPWDHLPRADALIAAVAHRQFTTLSVDAIGKKIVRGGWFVDVMAAFDPVAFTTMGLRVWRL